MFLNEKHKTESQTHTRKWSVVVCFSLLTLELHLGHDYSPLSTVSPWTLTEYARSDWGSSVDCKTGLPASNGLQSSPPHPPPLPPHCRHCTSIIVGSTKQFFYLNVPIHCCVYKPPREIRDGQWAALRALCLSYVPDCCVQGNLEEEESCYGFNLDLLHFWCEEQQVGD